MNLFLFYVRHPVLYLKRVISKHFYNVLSERIEKDFEEAHYSTQDFLSVIFTVNEHYMFATDMLFDLGLLTSMDMTGLKIFSNGILNFYLKKYTIVRDAVEVEEESHEDTE